MRVYILCSANSPNSVLFFYCFKTKNIVSVWIASMYMGCMCVDASSFTHTHTNKYILRSINCEDPFIHFNGIITDYFSVSFWIAMDFRCVSEVTLSLSLSPSPSLTLIHSLHLSLSDFLLPHRISFSATEFFPRGICCSFLNECESIFSFPFGFKQLFLVWICYSLCIPTCVCECVRIKTLLRKWASGQLVVRNLAQFCFKRKMVLDTL